MNVLCVIPARGGSKRVPKKNVATINGNPMIKYTIDAALNSKKVFKVVVSTDSDEIAEVAIDCGAEVVQRPSEYSLDTSPIEDAIRHAVKFVEELEKVSVDLVVSMQANVPVRKDGELDDIIEFMQENVDNFSSVSSAYSIDQRPEWMKIIDNNGIAKQFMPETKAYRIQDLPELYLLDGAIHVIKKDVLFENTEDRKSHAYLGPKPGVWVHDRKYATEIDNDKDFELAKFYLSSEK